MRKKTKSYSAEFKLNAVNRMAQAKTINKLAVPIRVATVHILQQAAALIDHPDQAAPGCMVFNVGLEVRRQVADPLAQKCYLDFR